MTKLEIAKQIIKEHYNKAKCGIFNTRNIVGDNMTTIYNNDGLTIDICYYWAYFEVFGLSEEEFKILKYYYYIELLDEIEKEQEVFEIVFNELKKVNLFRGIYDAKNGSFEFMSGISSVMEYIAYKVSEKCGDDFSDEFFENIVQSEQKVK